jgi:hypothetical protein
LPAFCEKAIKLVLVCGYFLGHDSSLAGGQKMSDVETCPKCFKRGPLKEKEGKRVYEHNLMYADPETGKVEFRFVDCPVDAPGKEEQK